VTHRTDTGPQPAGSSLAPAAHLLAVAGGSTLGWLFDMAALVRHGKPLHQHGVVLDAVVHRARGPARWGAAWLDEPGEDHGIARLSRAAGLPGPIPDIMGLALAISGPVGTRHDLLLASTGLGRLSRFMLTPRRDPASACYSSLFPTPRPAAQYCWPRSRPGPQAGKSPPSRGTPPARRYGSGCWPQHPAATGTSTACSA
jgi:hypothetical protein